VVVDDHPFFRDGISRGLSLDPRIEVLGEAGSGREAIDLIGSELPDVAVVDYQMPDVDGSESCTRFDETGSPRRNIDHDPPGVNETAASRAVTPGGRSPT
jgi:two-component system nitrate/nitrite response regulator NarL